MCRRGFVTYHVLSFSHLSSEEDGAVLFCNFGAYLPHTTVWHNPEKRNMNGHCHGNLRSYKNLCPKPFVDRQMKQYFWR
jgi:hypothetical protein